MSTEHEHRPEGGPAPLVRPRMNCTRLAVGTAGLAAVLGAGAYVVTSQIVDEPETTVAQEVAPIAPTVDRTNATPDVTSSAGAPSPASASPSISPVPTTDASGRPIPSHVVEEIKEARRKMAKDGVPVKPPILPKVAAKPVSDVKRTTTGSIQKGGIVRVITARGDLSGQEELAYVAGGVWKEGKASCTQTFQFSTNPAPGKRDNLLMCWRTDPEKSVIAMVVDPKGDPSENKALKVLADNWRSLD
jgi:hypothetical protein